jgi:hypothetical protein
MKTACFHQFQFHQAHKNNSPSNHNHEQQQAVRSQAFAVHGRVKSRRRRFAFRESPYAAAITTRL